MSLIKIHLGFKSGPWVLPGCLRSQLQGLDAEGEGKGCSLVLGLAVHEKGRLGVRSM